MKTNGFESKGTANYFFEMLCEVYYNWHSDWTRCDTRYWRSDCCNGYVTVHHATQRADEEIGTYYQIDRDGTVRKNNLFHFEDTKMRLEDLDGDDFELFSSIQTYKAGYVVLEPPTETDKPGYAKKVLSNLHNYIADLEPDYWHRNGDDYKKNPYPVLVGGSSWEYGLTEEFSYCSTNGMEIHIQTIHKFCKENETRKHYGCRPIPFRKNMDSNVAFHVTMVDFTRDQTSEEQRIKQCNAAIKELMGYIAKTSLPTREYDFDTMDYKRILVENAKWINTRIDGVLYDC